MALDKSAIKGIKWKLGEKFRIPDRVVIPPEFLNLQPSEYLFQEINTNLEERVIEDYRTKEENERKQQEELIEREKEKEKERNEMLQKDDLNSVKDRHHTSNNHNFSQNNIQSTPNILTPVLADSVEEKNKRANDTLRPMDLTPFENEQDLFDKVELLSIDDMEELGKVYSTMSTSQPVTNVQAASNKVSVKDLDFPSDDLTNDNQSNLNENDQRSTEKAQKLPPISYAGVQNGVINVRPIRSSKSNPDVHSNLHEQRPSSKSPPPRPSSGQGTTASLFTKTYNTECSNDDKNLNSIPNQNGNLQTWNPYTPLPPTTPINNDLANMDEDRKKLATNMIDMGFPRSSVIRSIEKLGKNDQKVLDYLCAVNSLVEETGASSQDVESALDVNNSDVKRAKTYLLHLSSLKQLGFNDQNIKEALKTVHNDYNKALDILTAS